jgi:hypothetical protein
MIDKILNTKNINYSSSLNGENLRQKIEGIFKQSNLNFVGKFTSQDEFETYDKWTYIKWLVPNFKRRTAYLYGKIIKSGEDTLISLKIKPNPVVAIFPILTVFIGLIFVVIRAYKGASILGLILIVVGIIFYLFGMFLTSRLQNNFEKYLDLQKV